MTPTHREIVDEVIVFGRNAGYPPSGTSQQVTVSIWLGVAAVIATLLGSLGVVGQIMVARRQANLEEAAACRAQSSAWRALRDDWEVLLTAGLGPTTARERGMNRAMCDGLERTLVHCRDARVQAQNAFDVAQDQDAIADLWDAEEAAFASLAPYEASIRRVLIHLAQVANLVFRRRVSIAAVYDAIGHDLLLNRDTVGVVVRHSYDFAGCVAPSNEEGRHWARLDVDEVSKRIGWASVLAESPGTLGRIIALLDALTLYAHRTGDAHHPISGDRQHSNVADPEVLAVRWRDLRPLGRMVAARHCWRAARSRHHKLGLNNPLRVAAQIFWPFKSVVIVARAAISSKQAYDEERWVPAPDSAPDQTVAVG